MAEFAANLFDEIGLWTGVTTKSWRR